RRRRARSRRHRTPRGSPRPAGPHARCRAAGPAPRSSRARPGHRRSVRGHDRPPPRCAAAAASRRSPAGDRASAARRSGAAPCAGRSSCACPCRRRGRWRRRVGRSRSSPRSMPANVCGFHMPRAGAAPMTDFPFDTIGFDLDGTLVDTAPDLARAVNHALLHSGREPVSAETTREQIGGGTRAMLTRAFERTGGMVPDEAFNRAYDSLLAYYEGNTSEHSAPYPGLLDALDRLSLHGCKLAVVTNKMERFAVKLLAELDLDDRFYAVLGGDTLGPDRAKPKRDMIDEALARCGGTRFAMVGDASFDVRAAHAAEVPCVVYRPGYHDMPVEKL